MWAIISVIISITSMAYSAHQASKVKKAKLRAKAEAERKAELAKGFQFVDEGNARPLPVVYGRQKLGGNRVYTYVTNGVVAPPSWAGFLDFPTMKSIYARPKQVHKLVNSNTNWTGTWSLVPSSDNDFLTKPGWVVTADDDDNWKFPSRTIDDSGAHYTPPGVNYVFIPFMEVGGVPTFTVPTETLSSYGFNFPKIVGTIPSFDGGLIGEKNMMLYIQQAISHGGLSAVYTIDVDKKPYDSTIFEYGQRIFVNTIGGTPDPWMAAADPARASASFNKVAFATGLFALNRDDPQYDGPPEMQFYVQGNAVKYVEKSGNTYSLSSAAVPTSNSALILLDYLMSKDYGKGLDVSDINLESFYWASQVCATRVIDHATKRGALWLSNSNSRHINLYECNISLDTSTSIRENIQKIIDTMAFAALVWSDGKYSLNLPYAEIWNASKSYNAGTVVQYNGNGYPQFFRRETSGAGGTPGSHIVWNENVIDPSLRFLNDDNLEGDTEFVVSWPSADTKLNHCTVRFMNEDRDFSEDTASWPSKAPLDALDTVYATLLQEDNDVPLESELFVAGCSTPFHAMAIAEQRVRASRAQVDYTFTMTPSALHVEPGDLIGFSSVIYSVPYTVLVVETVEVQQNGSVTISASTFDASFLAWNVADSYYAPPTDPYENMQLRQATNLNITVGVSNSKVSNYVLSWTRARDERVVKYLVQYTTVAIDAINEATAWTEIGTVTGTSIELPPIEGDFTFTVVAMSGAGRRAPMRSHGDGSEWPYIRHTLSAGFLQTMSAPTVNLSNDNATLVADSSGTIPAPNYAGSGTDITCYQGETALIYDAAGTTNGTWRLSTSPAGVVNITVGAITLADSFTARVADAAVMSADTAYIDFEINGKSMTGVPFSIIKRQTFTKVKNGSSGDFIYINTTSPVIKKDSQAAATPGAYSTITVGGRKSSNGVVTNYGWVTTQSDLDVSESARTNGDITTAYTTTSNISSVTVRLYETDTSPAVLDTEIIPVVFKGDKGSNAISVSLGNPAFAVPATSDGTVISGGYTGSGTAIYVFEGASRLVYCCAGQAVNGAWSVTRTGSGITAGAISDSGDFATVADHSAMTADKAAVTYSITGKSTDGTVFNMTAIQNFVKTKQTSGNITAIVSNPIVQLPSDYLGNVSSYTNSGTLVSAFEGVTQLTYDGSGTTAGKFTVSALGTNITPDSTVTLANAKDASYDAASAITADTASIVFTVTGRTLANTAFTTTVKQSFAKNKQGADGNAGTSASKTAFVRLFKWSTVQPAAPGGGSVYTWATASHASYNGGDGWSLTVPNNPGTPGIYLWQIEKSLVEPGATVTTAVTWSSGGTISNISQNGVAGTDGLKTADAIMYKWSITLPAPPAGTNVWTWSTLSMNAVNPVNAAANWSVTPPAATPGYTLYAAVVKVSDTATASATTVDWTTASLRAMSYAGANGAQGAQGLQGPQGPQGPQGVQGPAGSPGATGSQGLSAKRAYAVSSVATASGSISPTNGSSSLPPTNSWGLGAVTWYSNPPAPVAGQYLWQSDGIYNPTTGYISWNTPYWSSLKVGNLSVISQNAGTITAGVLQNSAGTFVIDLNNGVISISV